MSYQEKCVPSGSKDHVRPHINPRFSQSAQKIHVNPNFDRDSASKVLINPNFNSSMVSDTSHRSSVHYNPNFSSRPLPSLPSLTKPPKPARQSLQRQQNTPTENIYASLRRPEIKIDEAKKAQFEEAIKKSVIESTNKVLVNPKFSQKSVEKPTESVPDKENLPSSKANKLDLLTPIRKSAAFKKIGSRKLVRKKSGSPISPNTIPNASFKKIGSKKLIRIVNDSGSVKVKAKPSPVNNYQVKTKTKIVKSVKNTPSNTSKYRFSFITPLSMRKNKIIKTSGGSKKLGSGKKLSAFKSRFKLDRRSDGKQEPKALFRSSSTTSKTKLKKVSGSTYRVSSTKLQKVGCLSSSSLSSTGGARTNKYREKSKLKPSQVNPSLASKKVITVQGVKFSVADNGRKLKRLASSSSTSQQVAGYSGYSASVSQTASPGQISSSSPQGCNISPAVLPARTRANSTSLPPKVYLGGEEFDEVEPGVFTRSRHSLTRQSITQAKNKSINIMLKKESRSRQYCMFFNKFGKCTKKEAGSCPYLHDPDKVAVCRKFLAGSCVKEACLLSHKVAPEKMPVCKFFLSGLCTREACPYLHTKVSEKAGICEAFLKGYCANGSDCRERHVMACPQFDRDGVCKLARCPFPHVAKKSDDKKIAPAKPKRKSLGQTPGDHHKKSRVAEGTSPAPTARYYHHQGEDLEEKRLRLRRKIELAKQGWEGVTVEQVSTGSTGTDTGPGTSTSQGQDRLDESGPYERLDSGTESGQEEEGAALPSRPPMGHLGDFISIAGYSSEEEENCSQQRLI